MEMQTGLETVSLTSWQNSAHFKCDTIKKGYQTLQRPFPQLHAFYGQWVFFSSRLLSLLYCNRLSKFGLFPAGAALLHRGVQKALGHGTEQYMVLGDYSSPILHLLNNCIFYTA